MAKNFEKWLKVLKKESQDLVLVTSDILKYLETFLTMWRNRSKCKCLSPTICPHIITIHGKSPNLHKFLYVFALYINMMIRLCPHHSLSDKLANLDSAFHLLLPLRLLLHPRVELLVAQVHMVLHQLSTPSLKSNVISASLLRATLTSPATTLGLPSSTAAARIASLLHPCIITWIRNRNLPIPDFLMPRCSRL